MILEQAYKDGIEHGTPKPINKTLAEYKAEILATGEYIVWGETSTEFSYYPIDESQSDWGYYVHLSKIHYGDYMEILTANALKAAGIEFIHESQDKSIMLDFYLPKHDIYIECKRYYSERIGKQLAARGDKNVIVLQGEAAVKLFCHLLVNQMPF